MVSFWPWRAGSSSTASFEKTLSTLSAKIAATQAKLDRLRSNARRIKVLWTLYLTFAYLVYAIVLVIVVGYHNMGPYEWTGIAGGPVIIYGVRTLITTYFKFRIEATASRLKEQQEERGKTIQQLKDATKYDSTLELLEKYGGADGRPRNKRKEGEEKEKKGNQEEMQQRGQPKHAMPGRTNMPPPPTANIQRRDGMPTTPQPTRGSNPQPSNDIQPEALYAPNADFEPDSYIQRPPPQAGGNIMGPTESHWYDRIFDVLLGDDETAPKNRIVLICQACRLVNGQAPPGTKTLSELGVWKCMGCGAANGDADEGRRIVREVLSAEEDTAPSRASAAENSDEEVTPEPAAIIKDEDDDERLQDGPAASVKKRRGKGKR